MFFDKETKPWTLNGETIRVVDNNEHLGLIVSGMEEERKNIDENIIKCRNSLFALLGPVYAYRCLLSPVVQAHLWRTYNLPVLSPHVRSPSTPHTAINNETPHYLPQ